MSCDACTKAAQRASHEFRHGCLGCAARAVARGPNFAEARKTGLQSWRYRSELQLLGVSHDDVKAAAAADAFSQREA